MTATFKINPIIKEKVVLALDVDDINLAKDLIIELKDYVGVFKVGLQFYTGNGDDVFNLMNEHHLDYFLDVKFMDIPNTVAKASENVIRKGASFYNLHALGGLEMMKQSVNSANKVAKELGKKPPIVLAVTVLTSINNEVLNNQLKINHNVNEYAIELAKLAKEAGLTGVVASVFEAKKIKEACGQDFKVLCPGIRPEWAAKNDQKRLATPKLAIQQGADYLVIGRAVTDAKNRVEAMQKIYREIEQTLACTQIKMQYQKPATVLLENGMTFEGESFGAEGTAFGEIVFNTSMSGYQEILTDPSYAEQVVVMTYPEIGNYGINPYDFESDNVAVKGFVVKNYCENESHYLKDQTLQDYLVKNNIVAVKNVDTRSVTKHIREIGSMRCAITTEPITNELKERLDNYQMPKDLTIQTSVKSPITIEGGGINLAVIDLGIKKSIVENLKKLDCTITIFPADVKAEEILSKDFDAVLFSNGPANPKDATWTIDCAKQMLGKTPMFGICLGHQILSIVLGAETYKLKYGHRGGNHPVIDLETNKVLLTSQNHGYVVDDTTMPECITATYKNLNDNTLEGFKSPRYRIEAVQFHPESAPGPHDANEILQKWIEGIKKCQKTKI